MYIKINQILSFQQTTSDTYCGKISNTFGSGEGTLFFDQNRGGNGKGDQDEPDIEDKMQFIVIN